MQWHYFHHLPINPCTSSLVIGHAPGALHPQPAPTFVLGGARIRRREKRAAARKKAEEATKAAEILKQNVKETEKAEKAKDISITENVEDSTDEKTDNVINDETAEKVDMEAKAVQVQDAIIEDKEYKSKVNNFVKKICEVEIYPEDNGDIYELRNTVFKYFEKKTDVIEKVLRCDIENFGRNLRLVTLVKFRNGWTGYFSDKETNFSDLKGIRRMLLHGCKDLYNCGDPNIDG